MKPSDFDAGTTTMTWQAEVQPVVEQVMRSQDVAGMVIAVACGAQAPEYLVVGCDAAGQRLHEDTLFPVASVTKLATALAVLRLVDRGMLGIEDPLAKHVPEAAAARPGITLRTLLTHTSGLRYDVAGHKAPYSRGLDWPTLAQACLATPPVDSPGARVNYSNVGFGLLAVVVERVTGVAFPAALRDLVLAPLGIEGYLGIEPPRPPARIGGDLGTGVGTELERYNSPFWRSLGMPWGGLITTADGALRLVQAYAGRPADFLSPAVVAAATRDQTGGLPGGVMAHIMEWPRCPWGLGVELRGEKLPHMAPIEASPESFGHGGASGCLVWSDPRADVSWVMLTTRTFDDTWREWAAIGAAVLAAGGRR
jgi:CubicO group peptidase (beta-lactamase class C family)